MKPKVSIRLALLFVFSSLGVALPSQAQVIQTAPVNHDFEFILTYEYTSPDQPGIQKYQQKISANDCISQNTLGSQLLQGAKDSFYKLKFGLQHYTGSLDTLTCSPKFEKFNPDMGVLKAAYIDYRWAPSGTWAKDYAFANTWGITKFPEDLRIKTAQEIEIRSNNKQLQGILASKAIDAPNQNTITKDTQDINFPLSGKKQLTDLASLTGDYNTVVETFDVNIILSLANQGTPAWIGTIEQQACGRTINLNKSTQDMLNFRYIFSCDFQKFDAQKGNLFELTMNHQWTLETEWSRKNDPNLGPIPDIVQIISEQSLKGDQALKGLDSSKSANHDLKGNKSLKLDFDITSSFTTNDVSNFIGSPTETTSGTVDGSVNTHVQPFWDLVTNKLVSEGKLLYTYILKEFLPPPPPETPVDPEPILETSEPVPEPSAVLGIAFGALGLALLRKKKQIK
jgi:plasmid maintenance system killer protein